VKPGVLFQLGLLASLLALPALADQAADQHFLDRVQPLLQSKCVACHGPDKQKSGLRLDSREAVLKGGESGPSILPNKPDQSLLLQAVLHQKKDLEMPPKEKLTTNEIAVLTRWIRDGAPWPKITARATSALKPGEPIGDAWSDDRNPIRRIFLGQRLDLWSLQPVKRTEPPPPPSRGPRGVSGHPIDRFILASLARNQLKPSPEADRRTLARRLSFDLTGVPPTPEQVEAFQRDRSPDAYQKLVDQLLASPRYGEHQARLWLDVIRYSDSNGFDWDEYRPLAWRFRDYVIRSFNSDKPFDRFIREQIAGDELVAGPPRDSAEQDCLIATGYLRLGPHDNSAASFGEEGKVRNALMADLVETTSAAFLGLTMSCCRCHDHKYDPLSQADHYRLRAFFEPVKFADDLPLDLAADQDAIRAHNETVDRQLKPLKQQRDDLLGTVKRRLRAERVARLSADERELLDLPADKRTSERKGKIEGVEMKVEPRDKEIQAALTGDEKQRQEELSKQIDAFNQQKRKPLLGLLMTDREEAPTITRILFQGDPAEPRDAVEPGFISALDPNPARLEKTANAKSTGRRLALANWITGPANPFTARVLVNRVWQQHFGRGLVATPNDFGLAGGRPSHPELLDWLASEFVRDGWSLKKLHRLIVTSATYRQSSGAAPATTPNTAVSREKVPGHSNHPLTMDTENGFLSRQNPRRLTAEQLRDALLAVAGTLKECRGGPPIWPELPVEVLQANPAFLDDNAEKTKGWYPSPAADRNVRSVYLIQKRTVRVPFLETFDLPENSTTCARRNTSTVAPQALSLLNDSIAVDAARAFAIRLRREAGDDIRAQLNRAFELAFQRAPRADEQTKCLEFIRGRGVAELCRVLLNLNEFAYID
jgi:hypothetical protein